MKKLILLFALILNLNAFSQHLKKDGTPDKRYKENRGNAAPIKATSVQGVQGVQGTNENQTNQNQSPALEQCKGTTKKGTRCSRMGKNNGYCFQHGN